MAKLLSYEEKDTWIHRLSGVTKLLFFLAWTVTCMLTYDTRVLLVMLGMILVLFAISRTSYHQVGAVFQMILLFMLINVLAIYIFSPDQGTQIYGTTNVLFSFGGRWVLTKEQLFYELNVILKYFTIVPSVFLFLVTTNPSELAASMNRIGIPVNICYSFALALRYIPDLQNDFRKIKNAQQARGIEMSAGAKLFDRFRNTAVILFPLIFTSMDRIDTISNAMELRGFGKKKSRTWYMAQPLKKSDIVVLIVTFALMAVALAVTYCDGDRFYNPFV